MPGVRVRAGGGNIGLDGLQCIRGAHYLRKLDLRANVTVRSYGFLLLSNDGQNMATRNNVSVATHTNHLASL